MTPNELLPQVYDELRRLAATKLRSESPAHTLDATALVHEVFVKLQNNESFGSKSSFMRAAAVAMRRLLVDHARSRMAQKRGGSGQKVPWSEVSLPLPDEAILELDEALSRLQLVDSTAAQLVELRFFSNLTISASAEAMGMSSRSADRLWAYARAWLLRELTK